MVTSFSSFGPGPGHGLDSLITSQRGVGAPPILVTLQEVGFNQGCRPGVSEGRRPQSPTGGLNGGVVECRRPDAI